MTKTKLMLFALIATVNCFAQDNSKTKVLSGFVNLNDSANVYKALYENTPIEPEFKLAPKFAIVGADSKFVFSVGASMKFTASYDWGCPVRNPLGMGPSDLAKSYDIDRNLYQMGAGGSGIYFNIIGFPNTANQTGLFISIGVDKDSDNSYKLGAGQIYMRYRDFQCGYATSLYNDRNADAYTIDSHGPCASGAHSAVGCNWQHYVNKYIRLGIGIELPHASYTQIVPNGLTGGEGMVLQTITSGQYSPDVPLYIGYDWGIGHIRLSAIMRNINYVNLITGKNHSQFGNSLKITGKAAVNPLTFFWMLQSGWGSASYFSDNSSAGLDLVPDDRLTGQLRPTKCWGCIAAVQYNFTPNIFATAQMSYLRNYIPYYAQNATVPYNDQMRYGYTYMANAIWKISPLFSTGIEFRHAHRTDEDGFKFGNNRLYAMMLMTF